MGGDWGDGVLCFVYKEGEEESAFVLFPVSSRSTNEIKNVSKHLNQPVFVCSAVSYLQYDRQYHR